MTYYSDIAAERRKRNADAIAAFGVNATSSSDFARYRTIRQGDHATIFTIGYERRDADELLSDLTDAGVNVLVDVRERPVSRKPDFRAGYLASFFESSGIDYQSWPELGSTEYQREQLKTTGNLSEFRSRFRSLLKRSRNDALERLASLAANKTVALMCYERAHEECHRAVVADMVGKKLSATIVAIT